MIGRDRVAPANDEIVEAAPVAELGQERADPAAADDDGRLVDGKVLLVPACAKSGGGRSGHEAGAAGAAALGWEWARAGACSPRRKSKYSSVGRESEFIWPTGTGARRTLFEAGSTRPGGASTPGEKARTASICRRRPTAVAFRAEIKSE